MHRRVVDAIDGRGQAQQGVVVEAPEFGELGVACAEGFYEGGKHSGVGFDGAPVVVGHYCCGGWWRGDGGADWLRREREGIVLRRVGKKWTAFKKRWANKYYVGDTILVKLKLWELVKYLIKHFGLPLTNAYATLRQSVQVIRISGYCFLQFRYL